MQDSNARRPDDPRPDSDATSKKTLADLESSEKISDSSSESESDYSATPAPDGTGDESGRDDAGPI